MRLRTLRVVLPYLWTLVPMYGLERLADYYFLGKDPAAFYSISGLRLEAFIVCALLGSMAAGAFLADFRLAAATQMAAIGSMLAGVFLLCDPRVCYSAGPDGLEPIRLGFFLGSVALAAAAMGAAKRRPKAPSKRELALVVTAGFVAIAWYPVIFAFAGTRLLSPFDPWATFVLLLILAFSTSASAVGRLGWRASSAVPFLSLLLAFAASAGVAWEYLGTLGYGPGLMLAAAAIGGPLGASAASPGRRAVNLARPLVPAFFALSIILLLTMTLVVIPDAVSGLVPGTAASTQGTYSMGTPAYSGAYMDAPQGHADGAGVTLSFAGTSATAIQSDNFLAGGIGIHSAGCCVDGIDYAYRFDLYLFHGGNESILASGWEACDDNAACGGHSWKVLLVSEDRQLGRADVSENITLRIRWDGGDLEWSYSEGGGAFANFTRYQVPAPENHDFNTGVSGGVSLSSEKAAYFYQFGVMSRYPIGHGGWRVAFDCPSTLANGKWTCVAHAGTLLGEDSYWKVIWRWGEDYPDVSASSVERANVFFGFSSTNATEGFRALW